MTNDQQPQQEAADQDTHSVDLDDEAMKLMQAWALDQGFALDWLNEETITSEAGSSERVRFERVPFELQEFGTVLIPDPRILEQGPLKVGIFVFEPQHDPMARGRPQASALYNEIKDAAAVHVYHVHCALQLKQRLGVHHGGMTKKEAASRYDFGKYTHHVSIDLRLNELVRVGSQIEKERNQDRTEIGRSAVLINSVLAAQKNLGPSANSWADASITRSTTTLKLLGKAHYTVKTIESGRRATMAANRKAGSMTHDELQEYLFGGISHDRIRTGCVDKTIFSFFTGINASRIWVDTCLPEWQKFFELVVFTGQLFDGRPAILTEQIYDTYIAIDWALSKGHVQGEAEAQAYAFVIDQLHRLIDRNALRMIGENLAEDVYDVELVADFSGFKGD